MNNSVYYIRHHKDGHSHYKVENGVLYVQWEDEWIESYYDNIELLMEDYEVVKSHYLHLKERLNAL